MPIRNAGLAMAAAVGIGVAVTACGSSAGPAKPTASATQSASAASSSAAASPAASSSAAASPAAPSSAAASPAAAVPAGYTRVGGAAQGISIAAPASWVAINLAKQSIQSAANSADLKGISSAELVQDMTSLQKLHGVIVFDVKSATGGHFARNLNAYCSPSGVTEQGASGVPLVSQEAAAEFKELNATHVAQRDLDVGGVPGVDTSYQISSSSEGTIYGSQLEVLPAANKICFVTVTVGAGETDASVVSTAAATAQFP